MAVQYYRFFFVQPAGLHHRFSRYCNPARSLHTSSSAVYSTDSASRLTASAYAGSSGEKKCFLCALGPSSDWCNVPSLLLCSEVLFSSTSWGRWEVSEEAAMVVSEEGVVCLGADDLASYTYSNLRSDSEMEHLWDGTIFRTHVFGHGLVRGTKGGMYPGLVMGMSGNECLRLMNPRTRRWAKTRVWHQYF